MTTQEKSNLIRQAGKLYTLGITVEEHRGMLGGLVERGVACDAKEMREALEAFRMADAEWKRLETEHVRFRAMKGGANSCFSFY